MQINIRNDEDVIILEIAGKVDLHNAINIKNSVIQYVTGGRRKFVFSFKNVNYIDSTGIGVLLSCRTLIRSNRGQLRICGINDSIKKIFDLTKLTAIFKTFDEEQEAVDSFK